MGRPNSEATIDSVLLPCAYVIFIFIIITVFLYQLYIILSLVGFCQDQEKWIIKKEDLMNVVQHARKTPPQRKF